MIHIVVLVLVLATAACAQKSPSPSAAVTAAPAPASADAGPDILGEIALTRAGIQARRQAIVTSAMDLTAAESAAFWPLYRDYRTDMARVDDRLVDLILVYAANHEALSDDLAGSLLGDYLEVERARIDVKMRYVPRFQRVLPDRKVARFFQVDNKLEKTIQAELAAAIPLTR